MQRHSPLTMTLDGIEWVEKSAYDAVVRKLNQRQRTTASHNHQFAAIKDCFDSLPVRHANAPYAASAEAFRKHGLIVTGHCDVETLDMGDHDAALNAAPFISKTAKKAHGYAITVVRGSLIVCSTPHSQSYKAMGKDRFNRSKADVLEWASAILEGAA